MAKKNNNDLESERLRLEYQIGKAIEANTKSIESWAEAQKKIVDNAKLIKILDAEIAELGEENAAHLIKQREQLVGVNKELAKSKNLFKSIGNSMVTGFKSLLPSVKDVFNKLLEIDDVTRQTGLQIGFTGQRFQAFSQSIQAGERHAINLGFAFGDNVKMVGSLNDETGRQIMLGEQSQKAMFETARITGMAAEEMGTLVGQMDAFGLGSIQSSKMIMEIRDVSEKMGVNTGKVIKKFQQNLGLLNKLNFKGGVKSLGRMTAYSEKFKMNMASVGESARSLFNPESAIEASASLQTLGGGFAQLGDPFKLMYEARNDPEEYAKSLRKATQGMAAFDKQSGTFEMTALELQRAEEAAKALNMPMEEMVEIAKQGAKMDYIESMMGDIPKEQREMLAGMAEVGEGGEIMINGKALKDLSDEEREKLISSAKSQKELLDQAMSLQKEWKVMQLQLMKIGMEIFRPIVEWLSNEGNMAWLMDSIKAFMNSIIDGVKWLRDLLGPKGAFLASLGVLLLATFPSVLVGLFKVGGLILKSLGRGLMGIFSGIWKSKAASTAMSTGGAMTPGTTGGPNAAQTLASGKANKASGMGSMMKSLGSAAQILAIAGAIWILADALIKFNDVEWESILKGGVALTGLGIGLKLLQPVMTSFGTTAWPGIAAMAAMGVSMLALGYSMKLMGEVPIANLVVGLLGMMGVLLAFGTLAPVLGVGSLVLLAFGAALLMVGGAVWLVAQGFATVVDSFTNMFEVIGQNGTGLFQAGLGFLAMAAGIGILTLSLLAMSAASIFALPGLMMLSAATGMLIGTAEALNGGGSGGIKESIDAINSVDQSKIDSLKELASMMSFWGMFGGNVVTVEFGDLKVDGTIDLEGEGGGKNSTDWAKDPIFVRNLKSMIMEVMETDKKGQR